MNGRRRMPMSRVPSRWVPLPLPGRSERNTTQVYFLKMLEYSER
jgi:hypothetical protein